MLTVEKTKEFAKLYQKHFGVVLSAQEATEKAQQILNLYRVVYSAEGIQENNNEKKITKTRDIV